MTLQPCNGKSFVHTKQMVWASQWSVAWRTFYRQILSLLFNSFFFGNFRPQSQIIVLISSWKQELPVQISNQGSYPQYRPVNCKTEPFCAIPSLVPQVAPVSATDSLPGASGQLYCAASWLVTAYTILESHLTQGSVQGLSPRILYLFYAKNRTG